MGHDKLRKFKENESFSCLLQPESVEVLDVKDGIFGVKPHAIKGNWNGEMFREDRPIVVELGCGRGEYTVDLGKRNPDFNYIGVDIKGARLWRGAKTAIEEQMGNVAFIRTKIETIDYLFATDEVSEIWVTFPDPQPKKPNKRLTCERFLNTYKKMLRPGGPVHLKTDSQELHEFTRDEVIPQGRYEVEFATNDLYHSGYEGEAVEVQTFYESGYLAQGKPITYIKFRIK